MVIHLHLLGCWQVFAANRERSPAMTAQDAIQLLEPALTKDKAGRYCFACRKAYLSGRLRGVRAPSQFAAQDKIGFRTDEMGLTVEELKTCAVRKRFAWKQIESIAAGEPETDSGTLFQG
jgi:hypothetical protein